MYLRSNRSIWSLTFTTTLANSLLLWTYPYKEDHKIITRISKGFDIVLFRHFFIRLGLISLVKLIGAFGKIPLYRMVGSEGMGLYQMAYSYYGLVLTIITFGLPTALSLSSHSDPSKRWFLLKRSSIVLLIIGSTSCIFTFHFSPLIVELFDEPHLLWIIRAVSPALVVVPMLSLLRGYLQGLEYYTLISISELVEQLIRVAVMLLCVFYWLHFGMEFAICGATLAASISGICTLAFLLYFLQKTPEIHVLGIQTPNTTARSFFRSSSFIVFTQLIIPATDFLSAIIIPSRLTETGLTIHQATAVLGKYFGMGSIIISIPTLVTSALAHVLLTKFCVDWEKKRVTLLTIKIARTLKFVLLWNVMSAFILMYFSKEISTFVVGDSSLQFCIFYLSIAPIFSGLQAITTTALWAIEDKKNPLVGLLIGSMLSLTLYYVLIPIEGFQYFGIIIGCMISDIFSLLWNSASLYKKLHSHTNGIM